MNDRKLIVLTLDGLATSALSCYGSSWNSTPAIDALAGEGCLWERWITSTDDPGEVFQNWMQHESNRDDNFLAPWRRSGRAELITDDRSAIELGREAGFDRCSLIAEADPDVDDPADRIDQTQLGQLVATAIDRGSQSEPWSLLWLHSQFLTKVWDAPRTVEDDFQPAVEPSDEVELLGFDGPDVEDPIPAVFDQVTPPQVRIEQASHPDLVTSWMTTYGCQVRLIDDLISVMLQSLDMSNVIVLVAGTSGFSLGQNGWIGHRVGPLRSCHTRLPLIVGCDGPLRSLRLTSSNSLPTIIQQLAEASEPLISPAQWASQDDPYQPSLVTHSEGEHGITTAGWFLVRDDEESALFLKPDDVEDANDIARLRHDVVSQLTQE